jgi:hypothetical protein
MFDYSYDIAGHIYNDAFITNKERFLCLCGLCICAVGVVRGRTALTLLLNIQEQTIVSPRINNVYKVHSLYGYFIDTHLVIYHPYILLLKPMKDTRFMTPRAL